MKNSFYLFFFLIISINILAKSEVIEKRQKAVISPPDSIIDFFFDGNNYYVLIEETSSKKALKSDHEKITSKQKLIINGILIDKFKRVYIHDFETDYSYIEEKTFFEIKSYPNSLFGLTFKDEKGLTYVYLNNQKLGPFQDGYFYGFTNQNEPIYYFKKNSMYYVYIGSEQFGPYDDVKNFKWNPDVESYCFIFRQKNKYYVKTKYQQFGPYDGITDLDWNQNTESYCFIFKLNKKYYLNTIYQQFGPYDGIYSYEIKRVNDKLITIIRVLIGKNLYLILNNNQIGPFDDLKYDIFFTSDNQPIITAMINQYWYVFQGNEKFGPFDELRHFQYLENLGKIAFIGRINNKEYLYFGNEKFGPFDLVKPFEYLENLKKIIFIGYVNNKEYLYFGNEKFGPFERVFYLLINNNQNLIYSAKINEKWYIFMNNEKIGPYDEVANIFYIENQNKLYYTAKIKNKYYVFYGNERNGPYDNIDFPFFVSKFETLKLPYIAKVNDTYKLFVENDVYSIDGIESYDEYSSPHFVSFEWNDDETKFAFLIDIIDYILFYDGMNSKLYKIEKEDYRIQNFEIKWEPTLKNFLFFYNMHDEGYLPLGVAVYLNGKRIIRASDLEYLNYVNNSFVCQASSTESKPEYYFNKIIVFKKGDQEFNYIGKFIDQNSFYYYNDKKGELVYVKF